MKNKNAILFSDLEYNIKKTIKEDIKNRNYELLPYTLGGFQIEVKNNIVKQNLILYYINNGVLKHMEQEVEYKYMPYSEVIVGNFVESVKYLNKKIHYDERDALVIIRYEKFIQSKYFEEQEVIQDLLIRSYKKNHTDITWR